MQGACPGASAQAESRFFISSHFLPETSRNSQYQCLKIMIAIDITSIEIVKI
jgi:hypothetical protein